MLVAAGCSPHAPETGGRGKAAARHADPATSLLLVTLDTTRADALGFAGNERAETPNLDRLAATGRAFSRAYTHVPLTLPAHATIFTGRYPYDNGVRGNAGFVLGDDIPTLATLLHDAGFATAAVVGAFPLDSRFGLARGFDLYDDRYPQPQADQRFSVTQRPGSEVVAVARKWWNGQRGEKRFLWVHLFDPHRPYDPPEPWASRYPDDPYLGEIAATDSYLGPLLSPFFDGEEPASLVVVAGDHGEGLGEHDELTHGIFAYEPTLRVPLLLWGHGVEPGSDERLARHVDLLPTILDAAGLVSPSGLPGRSLLRPASAEEQPSSYFEALSGALDRGWAPLSGVLRGQHKYIHLPIPELYDVVADPAERRSLAATERRLLSTLRDLLPTEAAWPPPRGTISPEVEASLRSLGYLSDAGPVKEHYGPDDDPKRLIELDGKLHEVLLLTSEGRREEAVALLLEVIAARPTMATTYSYLAELLRDLGRPAEAVAALERCRELGLADESRDRQLALTLLDLGRSDDALAVLAARSDSTDPSTLDAFGLVYAELGRADEARAVLGRALSLDRDDARAWETLGVVALAERDWGEAAKASERAIALDDGSPRAWNNLGVALFYLGERRRGLDAWQRAVELDPQQYDTLFNLGIEAAGLGEPELARRALRRFLESAPAERYAADFPLVRQRLAELGG